jgi:hypothetical protein
LEALWEVDQQEALEAQRVAMEQREQLRYSLHRHLHLSGTLLL